VRLTDLKGKQATLIHAITETLQLYNTVCTAYEKHKRTNTCKVLLSQIEKLKK